MSDRTRPLLLGYLRKHLMMTEGELDDVKERLAYYAVREGYALGTVYVEEVHTWPAAFEALVEAVERDEVTAVVLPTPLHFAVLGAPATIKQHFEDATGVRVLSALEVCPT